MLQVRKHSGTFLALQQRGKSDTLDRVQPGPDRQAAGLTSLSHVELVSAARLQLGGAQGGNLKRGDRRERKLQAVIKQFISISKIKCEADPPVLSLWIWKKKTLKNGTAQMTDSSGVDPSRKTGDTRCGNCDKNHYPSFSFVFGSIFLKAT